MMMNANTKPNFSKTCNRFSQYLKELRSLGVGDPFAFQNLSSQINGAKEMCGATNATMNLFPENVEKHQEGNVSNGDLKSLNLFPLVSSSSAANTTEDDDEESTKNMAQSRELQRSEDMSMTTTSSMTIFYNGIVLVFDDLPEDKAQEIMGLASQGTTNSASQVRVRDSSPLSISATAGELAQSTIFAGSSDLPIARRFSLHRFMEKRRDRLAASAPYQLYNSSTSIAKSHSCHEKNMLMANFGQRHGQGQRQGQVQVQVQDLELKL